MEKSADLWNRAQQLAGRLRAAADISELAESAEMWPFSSDSDARSFVETSETMTHMEMSRELKSRLEEQTDSTGSRDPPTHLSQWNTYQSLASTLLGVYETEETVNTPDTPYELPSESRIAEKIQTLRDTNTEKPTVELARWLRSADADSQQSEPAEKQVARKLLASYHEGDGNIQQPCRELSQHLGYAADSAQVRMRLAAFDGCSQPAVAELAEQISEWTQKPETGPTHGRIRVGKQN